MKSIKNKIISAKIIARRKLIKQYVKLVKPREMKDIANYWPDMQHIDNTLSFKGNIIPTISIHSLINSLKCKKINIIGSGPSVKSLDLSSLKKEHNIFLNGSITIAQERDLPISLLIIMDVTFVKNRFDIIKSINPCHLFLSLGAACAIAERDLELLKIHKITIFTVSKGDNTNFLSSGDSFFSKRINNMFFDGGTVMSIAIQLAYHIAPLYVYLLGLDISNSTEPRFYEIKEKSLKSGLLKDYDKKILPFMVLAKKSYNDKNIELFNCSSISKIPHQVIPYSAIYEIK